MSNYSDDEKVCRVDFFKPSGKWYTTEAIVFDGDWHEELFSKFRRVLTQQLGNTYSGMTAVCLEPYSRYSHPIMVVHNE